MMFAPLIALALSGVGLVKDESKKYARAGVFVSGVTCSFWLLLLLLQVLR